MAKAKKNGVNKMEAVRQVIKAHGKDTKPLEIVRLVKSEHGVEMSDAMASTYKSAALKQLGLGGIRKRKRGRKPGTNPAASTNGVKAPSRVTGSSISIEDIEAVKKLCDRLGAEKVHELARVLAR